MRDRHSHSTHHAHTVPTPCGFIPSAKAVDIPAAYAENAVWMLCASGDNPISPTQTFRARQPEVTIWHPAKTKVKHPLLLSARMLFSVARRVPR